MRFARRIASPAQHGLTLLEVMVSCLIIAGLFGAVSLVGSKSFKLDNVQRGDDLNHFNFSRLTQAFYDDVHSSSAVSSSTLDGRRIVLEKADAAGFVTYEITAKAVRRGSVARVDATPTSWEELTDSSMFAIQEGRFATLTAEGSPASGKEVRRVDLKDLLATLNNNPQSKKLPLLSAFLRSLPAATPTPGIGIPYAVLAGQTIKYQGNPSIVSTPSGKGNVHSNGDLDRSGSSNTDGGLTYVGMSMTSGSHIPSSPTRASIVQIPFYSGAQLESLRNAAKAKGSIDIVAAKQAFDSAPWQNGNRYATLKGYYSSSSAGKKLDFGGNWEITLDGIAYIEGGLEIGGSFVLKGNGIIVCAERVTTVGNTTLGGSDSSSFALVSLLNDSQAVDTGGSTTITGIVFAPNGGIKLQGNTTVNGCLIAGREMDLASPLVNFDANQTLSILKATL